MSRTLGRLPPWLAFASLNGATALVISMVIATGAIGDGLWLLTLAAPLAAFATAGCIWTLSIRGKRSRPRVVIAGLLTGTVSHFAMFVLIGLLVTCCTALTGRCTDSLGAPPAGGLSLLSGSAVLAMFSLLFLGWITAPISIVIGLLVERAFRNRDTA